MFFALNAVIKEKLFDEIDSNASNSKIWFDEHIYFNEKFLREQTFGIWELTKMEQSILLQEVIQASLWYLSSVLNSNGKELILLTFLS